MKSKLLIGIFLTVLWLGGIGPSRGDVKPLGEESGRPDVLILIFAGTGGQDQIGITYAGLVSHAQVKRDVQALQTATGLSFQDIKISDSTAPIKPAKGKAAKMTAVECTAAHAVDPDSHGLTIEPYVAAFRNYPHIMLTYFVGSGFSFQGMRRFDDAHVHIQLYQPGSAYTYQILIRNPHFDKLGLPYLQPSAGTQSAQDSGTGHVTRHLTVGVVALLGLAAVSTGFVVYAVMARHIL